MKSSCTIILGVVTLAMFSLGALAQESSSGTISRLDPAKGTVAISQAQGGTTGSSAMSSPQEYKLQDPLLFNALKDGDRISFTVEDKDGVKAITNVKKQ